MNGQTQTYIDSHGSTVKTLAVFMGSRKKTVSLALKRDEFIHRGLIEHTPASTAKTPQVMSTFTRGEVLKGMKLVFQNATNAGPKACMDLPTSPNAAGVINGLGMTYRPVKGANKGKPFNLAVWGLKAHRDNLRRERNQILASEAIETGTDWYAAGVVNNSGEARLYISEIKARKAWARHIHGAEWFNYDKEAILTAAVVSQDPADFATPSLSGMNARQVISVAKQAGAPVSVVSGTGAGNRSRNWLVDNHLATL